MCILSHHALPASFFLSASFSSDEFGCRARTGLCAHSERISISTTTDLRGTGLQPRDVAAAIEPMGGSEMREEVCSSSNRVSKRHQRMAALAAAASLAVPAYAEQATRARFRSCSGAARASRSVVATSSTRIPMCCRYASASRRGRTIRSDVRCISRFEPSRIDRGRS